MPHCGNCGGFVTERYVKVFTPNDVAQPRTCPNCTMVREGTAVRESRSVKPTD